MSQQLDVKTVKQARVELTKFYNKVSSIYCTDELVLELMAQRNYHSQEMFDTLKELGVFKVDYLSEITLVVPDVTNKQLMQWGLLTKDGNYLLGGRYVLPIKSISGEIIALVGWHPKGGSRKYVTTPTIGFSRDASFFNLDCYKDSWENHKGVVYVVEGIFDTISLKSLGLPAIGNQGLEMSPVKVQILTRFSKVINIPDNDRSGRAVNPLTNRISNKGTKFAWKVENDSVFVTLPEGVKDVDDFIKEFDAYGDLISCQTSKYMKKLKEE